MSGRDFNLRFYDQTDAGVEQCVAELKAANPAITGHTVMAGKVGMNAGVKPSHEVLLHFADASGPLGMQWDAVTKKIYMKYASPKKSGTIAMRKPGQVAFIGG